MTLITTTPVDRTQGWWVERHQEKLAEAQAGQVDLIMIGDSITQAWEKQRSYPQNFAPSKVLNLGYGGDRTQNALWRLQNGEVDGLSPKLVTIMLGTNNITRDTPAEIAQGVKAVVKELRARLPESEIALLSVFPRDHPRSPGDREETEALNALLPEIATQEKVSFYNVDQHFLNPDGSLNAALYHRDFLHLSNEGYQAWEQILSPLIKKAGLELVPTEKPQNTAPEATQPTIVRLWPLERIGGEENRLKENYRTHKNGSQILCGVTDPHLTYYPVNSDKPTPAVIFNPGGAYKVLAVPDEDFIKKWHDLGMTVIVLKYRIPSQYDLAFEDMQRAVRMVRHHAEKWNIDPARIGLMGNSAGGHLAARLMNNYDEQAYEPIDEVDQESGEVAFGILQCSAYFNGLSVGDHLDTKLFHLRHQVAPTFLTYAKDDKHYPGGVNYAEAMKKAGYPIHFKVFPTGGHGMKGCDWITPAAQWLREIKMIK